MRLALLMSLFGITSFTPSSWAEVFVGNAGDIIRTSKGTFLLDLYEAGIHENPFFGSSIDPNLPSPPRRSQLRLDFSNDLLNRKLTDMNTLAPGLGDYALAAIKMYDWIFETDSAQRTAPAGKLTVTRIAERSGGTIRINEALWRELDEKNRIALVIHEAVSSLLRADLSPIGKQSQRDVTEIIGWIFSEQKYLTNPAVLRKFIANRLQTPSGLEVKQIRRKPVFELGVSGSDGFEQKWNAPTFEQIGTKEAGAIDAFIASACRAATSLASDPKTVRHLEARIVTNGLSINVIRLKKTADPAGDYQNAIAIEEVPAKKSIGPEPLPVPEENCRLGLSGFAEDYLAAQVWQ